jgi:hypothetical protein
MHVHLPKPLHGWRAFVGEVGIIVLGVLIALGAEQVVETLHWRAEMNGERQALYSEARENVGSVRWRQRLQPCIDARLAELNAIFHAHAAGRNIMLSGPVGRPVTSFMSNTAWQVALSSQAVSHMSLSQKLAFARAFSSYENLDQALLREQDAWLKLGVLDDPALLSDGDWPALRQAYAEATTLNTRIKLITQHVLSVGKLGQRPTETFDATASVKNAANDFCRPIVKR